MQSRLERERDFHNQTYDQDTRQVVDKFYSITESSRSFYRQLLLAGGADGRVLEYGCGPDSEAFMLARHGAQIVGIDISEIAIQQARQNAIRQGISPRVSLQVMNAEALRFEDAGFDLVCGMGILHHLELSKALPEIARVLKPGGQAVFVEPLGHNPLINLYRHYTPHLRTADEHPLLNRDLAMLNQWFADVTLTPFHLSSLCAVPFWKRNGFLRLVRVCELADRALFRLPLFRRQAWQVVIQLARPCRTVCGQTESVTWNAILPRPA